MIPAMEGKYLVREGGRLLVKRIGFRSGWSPNPCTSVIIPLAFPWEIQIFADRGSSAYLPWILRGMQNRIVER